MPRRVLAMTSKQEHAQKLHHQSQQPASHFALFYHRKASASEMTVGTLVAGILLNPGLQFASAATNVDAEEITVGQLHFAYSNLDSTTFQSAVWQVHFWPAS